MLQEAFNNAFSFDLENKKITFKMILWQDAIKAQNAIHLLATNTPENIDEGNKRLLNLALKYTRVETQGGDIIESPTLEIFSTQFENIFACVELSAQFRDYVLGFLQKLPSFQRASIQD